MKEHWRLYSMITSLILRHYLRKTVMYVAIMGIIELYKVKDELAAPIIDSMLN